MEGVFLLRADAVVRFRLYSAVLTGASEWTAPHAIAA